MKPIFTLIIILTFFLSSGFTGRAVEPKSESLFIVNTTNDSNDSSLMDTLCADSEGKCSLRAAIQQINYNQHTINQITVPTGNYVLLTALPPLSTTLTLQGESASGTNATRISTISGVSSGLNIQSDSIIRKIKFFNFTNGINVISGEGLLEECVLNGNQKGVNIVGGNREINFTIRRSTIQENYKGIWLSSDNQLAALYLENSIVSRNEDNNLGCGTGARVRGNSSLYAFNSSFSENSNSGNGGAICTETGGRVTLEQSYIISNQADDRGGGIYMDGSGQVKLINGSMITGNIAFDGGGIYNTSGNLVLESPTDAIQVSSNQATNAYGGIFINRSSNSFENRFDNVIIRDNRAPQHGGIAFKNYGVLSISNSSIISNVSYLSTDPTPLEGDGGGLYIECTECLINIVNTTISTNSSSRNGGGLALKYGHVSLRNVTMTGNIADSDNLGTEKGSGGGIYNESGVVYLRNSIVANNQDLTIAGAIVQGYDIHGDIQSNGYNLIGTCDWLCEITGTTTGNIVGVFNSRINPYLGAMRLDSTWNRYDQLVHPLLLGSPAINAGDPLGCTGADNVLLLEDQVAAPRSQAGRCDMGAYESNLSQAVPSQIFLPMLLK